MKKIKTDDIVILILVIIVFFAVWKLDLGFSLLERF